LIFCEVFIFVGAGVGCGFGWLVIFLCYNVVESSWFVSGDGLVVGEGVFVFVGVYCVGVVWEWVFLGFCLLFGFLWGVVLLKCLSCTFNSLCRRGGFLLKVGFF